MDSYQRNALAVQAPTDFSARAFVGRSLMAAAWKAIQTPFRRRGLAAKMSVSSGRVTGFFLP